MAVSLSHERSYPGKIVAGVDEVGRGCLAGPVFASAVILPYDFEEKNTELFSMINDSKKLSEKKRNKIYNLLSSTDAIVSIGAASAKEVDMYNIERATLIAMTRAINNLAIRPDVALVDGNVGPFINGVLVVPIIDADESCASVAAASIIAKVNRDSLMKKLANRYPIYGWERNSGYGTNEHYKANRAYGITHHHRQSFRLI